MKKLLLLLCFLSTPAFAEVFGVAPMPTHRPRSDNAGVGSRGGSAYGAIAEDASIMAATYAAARYAEKTCAADFVRVNYVFFQKWIAQNGGKTSEMKNFMRREIAAAKGRIAAEIATKGADDWCDDFTSAVFWNYKPPYGPIYYQDELGLWWSQQTLADEESADLLDFDFGF
jgi:hypothetical protein